MKTQKLNATDPDSRLMKDGATGAILQSYNAQAAAAGNEQIIVVAEVTSECNDKAQLVPMVKQVKENLGAATEMVSADCGYWSEEQLAHEELTGIGVLVPPDAEQRKAKEQELPANAPRAERAKAMRKRLNNPAGKAAYAQRKAIVEPVFVHIKERRSIRRFSLRGLAKVRAEWALICLTHNLLKLYQHRMDQAET